MVLPQNSVIIPDVTIIRFWPISIYKRAIPEQFSPLHLQQVAALGGRLAVPCPRCYTRWPARRWVLRPVAKRHPRRVGRWSSDQPHWANAQNGRGWRNRGSIFTCFLSVFWWFMLFIFIACCFQKNFCVSCFLLCVCYIPIRCFIWFLFRLVQ